MPALTAALYAVSAADTLSKFVTQRRDARGAVAEGNFEGAIADRQAADALTRGQKDVYKLRSNVRQLVGEQTTGAAGQGIDITSGSSQDLINESHMMEDIDETQIRNNAALEAWGFKTSAVLSRYAGKRRAQDYNNQAWGTLATGGAQLIEQYSKLGSGSPSTSDQFSSVGAQVRGMSR